MANPIVFSESTKDSCLRIVNGEGCVSVSVCVSVSACVSVCVFSCSLPWREDLLMKASKEYQVVTVGSWFE